MTDDDKAQDRRLAKWVAEGGRLQAIALDLWTRTRLDWGFVTDRLAQTFRRERSIGAQERRFLAETLYGLVRQLRRIDHVLAATSRRTASRDGRDLDRLLALLVIDGALAPADAAAASPDVDWARAREVSAAIDTSKKQLDRVGLGAGMPDWLAARLIKDFGDGADAIARGLNARAPMTIRANTLKIDRAALATQLRAAGLATSEGRYAPAALHVDTRTNLFGLQAFKDGLFEAQDEGSQLLAELALAVLPPSARKIVVDLCAGAGGKSLALAAGMQNRGRILATDVDGKKLEELRRRARRAGATNLGAQTLDDDGGPWPEALAPVRGKADIVLVDAPCSGLGALRRNPEARYRLAPEDIEALSRQQLGIARTAAQLVRPGGFIVYATCSLLPAENRAVVEALLRAEPSAKLERVPLRAVWPERAAELEDAHGDLQVSPDRHGTDGFYASVLRKGA
jgi:16S rRNA (cytosine967-C5)-methyltransferase